MVAIDPKWSRVTAYHNGVADGENGVRESIGDAIMIIRDELGRAWVTDAAADALKILVDFAQENDNDTEE
jgi:hypothetical protein